MAEMKRRGLSMMSPAVEDVKKPEAKAAPVSDRESGNGEGEEQHTTITHHDDGTHSMESHGETSEHPDHLHMLAELGHKITGGDKHHVVHDDGMQAHSHGVHESGEHEETKSHDSPEDAANSLHQFLGGENGQPEAAEEQAPEPAYGGMGA